MSKLLFSQLGIVCRQCDQYHPPSTPVCQGCGSPLMESPQAAPKAGPPGLKPSSRAAPPATPPARSPTAPSSTPVKPTAPAGKGPPMPLPRAPSPPPRPSAPGRPLPFALAAIAGPARGQRFALQRTTCAIGRSSGNILFPGDPFVSSRHALLEIKEDRVYIRDDGSTSGVFVSIREKKLTANAYFAIGRRLFRYAGLLARPLAATGRPVQYGSPPISQGPMHLIEEILVGNRPGRARVVSTPVFSFGQEGCDWNFPQDPGMAPRHCELTVQKSGITLKDASSGLGTFIRITEIRALAPGSKIRIGEQVLQLEQTP